MHLSQYQLPDGTLKLILCQFEFCDKFVTTKQTVRDLE